jgi:uncharacterized protein
MLNAYCNLKCTYCYEHKYGFKHEKMDERTIDAAMAYIDLNCAEGSEVGIYGGEPLIEFELIKYLFNKYPTYNYSLFTNTILMTEEIFDFLCRRQDFLIMDISLDGTRESQIKNRGVMYDEKMVRKILKMFKHTGVRMLVTEPDKCYDNCVALIELGAKRIDLNYPNFTFFPGEDYKKVLQEQVDRVRADYKNVSVNNPYYCTDSICAIGTERVAIVPNGDIYPCDVFYFVNKYKVGDIFNGINRDSMDRFVKDFKFMKSKDRPCPAHNYCMGNDFENKILKDICQ